MRRLLLIPIAGLSIGLAPLAASAASGTTEPEGTEIATDETFVTLAGGKSLSECVSALPKPDCRTSDEADGKQLALLGFLVAGLGFVGWRITRGIRAQQRLPHD